MRWYYAIIANLDIFLLLSRYFLHSNTKNMTLTSFSFRAEIITLIKKKKIVLKIDTYLSTGINVHLKQF